MLTTFKAALAFAAATALLCSPAISSAALAPMDPVVQAVDLAAPAEPVVPLALENDSRQFAQAVLQKPLALKLRGQSDLALWNLVATVHAQQKNNVFDLVDISKKTVWDLEKEKVSAVPLPGVVWLFVMAALGLAGTRLKRTGQAASPMAMATA